MSRDISYGTRVLTTIQSNLHENIFVVQQKTSSTTNKTSITFN